MFLFTNARIIPVKLGQIARTIISSSTLTDHYEHISRALVTITHFSHIDDMHSLLISILVSNSCILASTFLLHLRQKPTNLRPSRIKRQLNKYKSILLIQEEIHSSSQRIIWPISVGQCTVIYHLPLIKMTCHVFWGRTKEQRKDPPDFGYFLGFCYLKSQLRKRVPLTLLSSF